jgi:hypothetical protein
VPSSPMSEDVHPAIRTSQELTGRVRFVTKTSIPFLIDPLRDTFLESKMASQTEITGLQRNCV